MLNCQRIHFFLSFKKLRCCTTSITVMALKCPWALLLLGNFFLGGGGGGRFSINRQTALAYIVFGEIRERN